MCLLLALIAAPSLSGCGGDSGTTTGPGDGSVPLPPPPGVDGGVSAGSSVLQFHNHPNRDGFFVDAVLSKANAGTMHRDTAFNAAVNGKVYASPLYVQPGPGDKGTFYVATESNDVYALDEATGAAVWHQNMGAAPTQTGAGCGNISPIGITGTPAIDLETRTIVFDSASATAANGIKTHTIYGLSIDDGSMRFSVDVSTLKDPTGLAFTPAPQNQRGAVLIVSGVAYVVYGGHYGDCGSYHGWVVGVPLASPASAKAWATQARQAGIWGVGGAASDGQSIFVSTGNGQDGANMTWMETEGIFRLDPGPTFTKQPQDYFAPTNYAALDQGDIDMSGSGPLVVDAPALAPQSALVVAQGKDGNLYLLDRTNLGGVSTANVGMLHVTSGEISNGGAFATVGGTTYVVVRPNGTEAGVGCPNGTTGDLVAVKLDPSAAQKMTVAWCANSHGQGSPIITSSDGNSDALVWAMAAEGTNRLYAWDLTTGAVVLAGGGATDALPLKNGQTQRHFTTVLAANGRILVPADGGLYAYTH
jgi:outer membrane protein assembly factor BamB